MAGQTRGQPAKLTVLNGSSKAPAGRASSGPASSSHSGEPLTDRQKKILSIIERHMTDFGRPPTIREIGSKAGISSTSVVNYHLNKLQVLGMLDRWGQVSRGLKLNTLAGHKLGSPRGIPLLGKIAAGKPIPVPEPMSLSNVDPDDLLDLGYDSTLTDLPVYALEVQGTSMIDALVGDGDIVVMEPVEVVENGQMAAVWIKDTETTTLKRFFKDEFGNVTLRAANPQFKDIELRDDNVRIMGRVVSVIRRMNDERVLRTN